MNNISTGFGLCVLGLGVALWPIMDRFAPSATAAHAGVPATAIAAAAMAQAGPTVVWMGVMADPGYSFVIYHRLWSDGRTEFRSAPVLRGQIPCGYGGTPTLCSGQDWHEVPPPAGGNGFACRADMNGDRSVDVADLGLMLNAWGQQSGCEPEATYPCLDLANLAGGAVAAK